MIRFFTKLSLAFLLITVLSCERDTLLSEEDPVQSVPSTPIDKIRSGFSLDKFEDPAGVIKGNIQVQWENYSAKTIEATLWYEFGVTQQQKADMVSQFQEAPQYKLLARLDENNAPHYFLVKLAPEPFITAQEFSYLNPEGFSGTVSLHNPEGEVVFLEYYKKGQVQNTVQDISIKGALITPISNKCMQKGTAMAKCETALECAFVFAEGASTGGGCAGGTTGGSYVAVRTDHYTDWYNIRGDGTADYSHTQFNGSSYDYIYVSDTNSYSNYYQNSYNYYNYNGHGAYGNDEGYYTETPPANETPERIILDVSIKNTKVLCVYNKMVDNDHNINWILENFRDGNNPSEFDLILTMSYSLDDNVNASTVKSGNTFIIKINANRSENINTTLTIARTIIHEAIHARLREFASRNGSNATSFPGVYEYYQKLWEKLGSSTNGRSLSHYDSTRIKTI